MADTMRQIARSEGVIRGFYRGWTVSLLLYAPYRCAIFLHTLESCCFLLSLTIQTLFFSANWWVVYGVTKDRLQAFFPLKKHEHYVHATCGVCVCLNANEHLWGSLSSHSSHIQSILHTGHRRGSVSRAYQLHRGGQDEPAGGHVRGWTAADDPLRDGASLARGRHTRTRKGLHGKGAQCGALVAAHYPRLRDGQAFGM